MNRPWWVPLTGVAFIVLAIVGGIIGGEPPGADEPAGEIVAHYVDNDNEIMIGAAVSLIGIFFFLVFASYLRTLLRNAPGASGLLANVSFAGAIILAIGGAIDATLLYAMAETVEDIEPASIQTLQALWDNDFAPFVLGAGAFLLGAGLSIVYRRGLPQWLGWIAIVFGVLSFAGPIGFIGFLGGGLWIIVTSIVLTMRARSETPAAPTGTAVPGPNA